MTVGELRRLLSAFDSDTLVVAVLEAKDSDTFEDGWCPDRNVNAVSIHQDVDDSDMCVLLLGAERGEP